MDNSETDRITVTFEERGERLDKILANRYPNQSRAYFQHLIDQGLVLLNQLPVKKRVKPKEGDEIEVEFALTPELTVEPENIPLDILYEDDYLLAINKPAGLVVHPGAGNWSGTFVNALLYHCKEIAPGDSLRPGIVHRLDKDTSGVLLAAKTSDAHQKLVSSFAAREVKKTYLAITCGNPKSGMINQPIGRHPVKRKEMTVKEGGKEAITRFVTLAHSSEYSLVKLFPKTGRTHQIRVHMKFQNTPIVADSTYGKVAKGVKRHLLHAYEIALSHPITSLPLIIKAPLHEDFKEVAENIAFNYQELIDKEDGP